MLGGLATWASCGGGGVGAWYRGYRRILNGLTKSTEHPSTGAARKLEYHCPPTPQPGEEVELA